MPLFDCEVWDTVLEIIGVLTVGILALCAIWTFIRFCYFVWVVFLPCNKINLPEKYGKWALVTGCTEGIGKAYAIELAKRGLNIVLASRTQDKLETFANILVNNVGKHYDHPMLLEEVSEQDIWDMINLNIGITTLLTRLVIKQMRERGQGAIVNVSSGSELLPLPLMNICASSKVYVKYFSEALREEYSKHGITVQYLTPFYIDTNMIHYIKKLPRNSIFMPSPESFAKYAINTLGKMHRSSGYWAHAIQYFFMSLLPLCIRIKLGGWVQRHFRQDYLSNPALPR